MRAFFRAAEPPEEMKDWAIAIVRVVVGFSMFLHGWQKLFQFGITGVTEAFSQMGVPIPEVTAPLVSVVEFAGGAAVLVGFATRLVVIPLAIDMLAAMLIVHVPSGFFAPQGVELPLLLFGGFLALLVGGPGALSIDRMISRARAPVGYAN